MFSRINASAAPLTEEALARAEQRVGRKIPGPFRSFLLEHNGGWPDAADFRMAGDRVGTTQPGTIKNFLGIDTPQRTLNLDYVLDTFRERIPSWSFPVARDPGGNLILLAAEGPRAGKVYFWDHEREADEGRPPTEDNLYLIANSFDEFLDGLTGS